MIQAREVREMRDAATVLGIIRDRGQGGLPLEDVYRQLYNRALYMCVPTPTSMQTMVP